MGHFFPVYTLSAKINFPPQEEKEEIKLNPDN